MNQRLTRQDMKRNELSTALGKGYDYAESHGRTILIAAGSLLALALLAGFFYMYRNSQAEKGNTALARAIEVYQAPIDPAAPKPDDPVNPIFADEAARQTKAKALFQELYEKYGSTVAGDVASVYLAQIAMAENQPDRARELWNNFLDENSEHLLAGQTRVNLIRLDRSQGKGEAVAQTLTAMLDEAEPPLPMDVILNELATTQEQLNKTQEAVQSYQRILDEFPQSPYAREARERIVALDPSKAGAMGGGMGMGMPGMPGF
jgi:predicted negative regulator of RcsB-dependent stress response